MFKEENRHYSLRKLSIGLASVLIGISFASSMNSNSVKADTVNSGSNDAQTVVKGSAVATKIDAKDDANAIESNTESAPEASKKDTNVSAQDIKQKAMKATEDVTKLQAAEKATKGNAPEAAAKNITDSGQAAESTLKGANLVAKQQNTAVKGSVAADKDDSNIKNDSLTAKNSALKATVETAKQGLETPVLQHSDSNETALNAKGSNAITENMLKEGKTEVKENQVLSDPAKSKLKMATLLTPTGKKLNAQMLFASKVVSPIKDTNGGFDEATWGKLDVSKWTIKTLTDADVKDTLAKSGNLELTAYNGDEQHVIIPNLLDIYNAGKADSAMIGNLANEDSTRVVISKDLLSQFSRTATSIAFSKTHTDHISNKDITQMSDLTKTGIDHLTKVYSKDSDLSNAFSYFNKYSNATSEIYTNMAPRVKLDATNFDVSNVTNMTETFAGSNYDGLSTIADWNTSNVTTMGRMFLFSPISYADLSKWNFSKIAQYAESEGGAPGLNLFLANYNDPSARDNTTVYLGNNKTIPSWVLDMNDGMPNYCIFRANENTGKYVLITSDSRLLANSNGAYNHLTFTDDTGKQTKVDIPMAISTENTTGNFDSVKQRVLDFVNAEAAKQAAPIGKKWVITNTDLNDPVKIANANFKLIDTSLPVLNTNDAYALDEKNGLHEHANVNDNGGYDKDFWGAIDLNNWNYTQDNAGDITLSGYKGSDNTKIIIPNIADFAHGNVTQTITLQVDPNVDTNKVYISSSVMHDLAKNATRIGLSKTANKKVIASNTDWSDAFGGMTNEPNTNSNANGGMWVYNPNLTAMDLHNLDTTNITNMSAMFNGGRNLNVVGDLSQWNTANVADMTSMFQTASSLTNIGNLDNWDTSKVADMTSMFNKASKLTNIGDLSKWQTGNVTDMNSMFSNAANLTNIGNLDNWNTSKVINMRWMFGTDSGKQSHLTNIGDLSKWDTSNVTDMTHMFNNATNLTNIGDLSKWQTGNVTDMNSMFYNVTNLTNIGNLDNWNTSKVTDMSWMFGTDSGKQSHLTNIGDLSKWQTGNVTDMHDMFAYATNLTNIGNLDNWDTNKVTDMHWMFGNVYNLTNIGDLSKWQTGNVTDMYGMFYNATNLTDIGELSKWQTGNVTDMHNMFANAANLTNIGNLDNWDTSKVTDMHWMFGTDTGKQSHLTNIGDLSKWQTGNVTDMHNMFTNATNLTNIGDLSKWQTGNVTDMSWMFGGTTNLTNIGDLSKWQTGNVTDMNSMFANATSLTNIGNLDNWDTNKVTDMHLMFAVDYSKQSHLTHIGDLSKWDTSHVTDMNNMFANKALLHLNISNWNLTKLANKDAMKYMFANVTNLTVIANDLKLPTWYENEINDADYFWNNHIAVITNVPELIKATGDINNLKIDNQDASRSIFYDSKGSSDAIKVLTDANNQYIADYHKANPTKVLKLADTVDQNDPIALANASFVTLPYKLADSNTNDAFALDSKHGLHEHINVNDNGGYDADFWGKINVDDWNYTVNGDRIEINGLKDGALTGTNDAVIVPNLDDFKLVGKDGGAKTVYISMNALGETAKHKYYGLSKTNDNKFATDSDLSLVFYKNNNLTHADLNSLNTSNTTNMNYMFSNTKSLTDLDVSNWDTGKATTMTAMFIGASSLTNLDASHWDTSNVTNMGRMFTNASSLTNLDVSHWDTGKVTDMHAMFYNANSLTSLDVTHWDTSKVTNMRYMFDGAHSLMNLNVSDWDTSKVTNMRDMFNGAGSLALTVNGDKFADYLVKNNFANSNVNSSVKSVTTNNTKLLQLLTNDSQHDSATRTIVLTFPAGYSPDLTKYHLTKNGNTYQIKQSVDYDKSYVQGTVLINATDDITKHHVDTTKPNKLSDTWQPNYDKLVLAHKNSDGSVSFDAIQLPKVPGYKTVVKTVASPVNPARALFAVSFMALPKPVTPAINDVKPAKTVTPVTPVAIEVAKSIKTEPKVATTPKVIDLSDDAVFTTPKETTWQVANNLEHDTYHVSNGKYTVELPHISNAQLHVIANDSTKDSVLFTYKGQNTKYVFNIKFANGHYLLATYEIKSGKLVKLIDYNFIKSSKMIDTILDWLKLK